MPTVPEPILHKLRCVRCKRWLSCGPVTLLPNGGSICGRCHIYREGPGDQYRHFAFEALACYFKFPCKHWENNCPEFLSFKKVLDHEKHCSYGSTCGLLCSHPGAAFKSKRHLNTKAAIKLEITPDVVLEYLRCAVCAGYLSCAPVYLCQDGTSICHRCSDHIQHGSNSEYIRDNAFEAFVDMMIFPCIFRYRGCTQIYKFGEEMMAHESDCPYGKYNREQRSSRQLEPLDARRNDNIEVVPLKERGVIKTHSGHIYATITPNAPLFAPQPILNKQEQGMFMDEFQRHRDNLANKWGMPTSAPVPGRQYSDSSEGYFSDPRNSEYNSKPPKFGVNGSFVPTDGASRGSLLARTDSVYENTQGNPVLIQELRAKQQLRKHPQKVQNPNVYYGDSQALENRYYQEEEPPRKMEYSVYS